MRWPAVVGGLAAVVAIGAGAWIALGGDDDGDGNGDRPTVTSLPEGGLPDRATANAAELEELLLRGRESPVHAVFETEGDTSDLGGDLTLELWRRGDQARYENRLVTDEGVAVTTSVIDGDHIASCSQVDDGPPSCTEGTVAGGIDPGALLGMPLEGDIDVADREVGGVAARCFLTEDAELCVDDAGIPLRLSLGDARLVRVVLDDDVTDADFAPPS